MASLRRPGRGPLLVAACVAAGVFFGGFAVLERMQAQGAPLLTTAVLVATRDIAADQLVTRDRVRVQAAPAGAPLGLGPALATDLPRVLGSRALAPILAGEPLARARLSGSALGADNAMVSAAYLPRGYARYTVPVGALAEPLPALAPADAVEVLAALPRDPVSPGITATVQPVDAHAMVVDTQEQPPAVTLLVPRSEVATLAWLRGQGAAFTFALVGATDRAGDLRGVGAREFRSRYRVPSD